MYPYALYHVTHTHTHCARASKLTTTNMYIARARCECQMAVGSGGLNACWSWGRAVEFKFLAWSSIAQSVCQQAFGLLANRCLRPSGFESCLQQRKTTCLLSIRISLACARASKLTTTNMYIARARCECQMAVGSGGLNACWSWGRAVEFKFLAWSSIAQSVCQQAFGLLANRCLRPSGFESCLQLRKTTCLLSIRISLACARASKLTTANTYIHTLYTLYMYDVCIYTYKVDWWVCLLKFCGVAPLAQDQW